METLDYTKLTDEQKRQLRAQMDAEERQKSEAKKKIRDDYDSLKEDLVQSRFKHLQNVSASIEELKIEMYNDFGAVLALKKEVNNLTDEQMELQQSHTFTSADGKVSIIIGSNVIDGWSDDVEAGIIHANECIENLISDPVARDYLKTLLRPDKNGVLKAGRVLELGKKANEHGHTALIDAINFIQSQYRPQKTSTYIKARYKDENEQWKWLPLSMAAV